MSRFPFHMVLIALFPVVFLYTNNMAEVSVSEIIFPGLTILIFAGLFYGIAARLTGAAQKSALIVSLFLLLFFSFRNIAEVASGWTLWGLSIGRGRYVLIATVLIFMAHGLCLKQV